MSAAIVGAAVVGAAGSAYAANQGGKGGDKASQAQMAAAGLSEQTQRGNFAHIQRLLAPYAQAGTSMFDGAAYLRANPDVAADPYYGIHPEEHYNRLGAREGREGPMTRPGALQGQQTLLGMNGADAQREAISQIENSPYFSGLVKQGENAILANASATGGLRGGNTQGALAQFRPNMLAAAIDQQYQRLGGLVTLGQNAAAGVGTAGTNFANASGANMQQLGAAQAGGILAQSRAQAQGINGLTSAFGTALSGWGGIQSQPSVTGGAPTAGTPYGTGNLNNNFGGSPVYF